MIAPPQNSPPPSTPLTARVLAGFKWSTLSALLNAVLHLAVLSVLARLLSPRDFGLVGIALIFTNFAERLGQFGIGHALVQREHLTERHLRTGTALSILSGFLIFSILWCSAPGVASFFSEPEIVGVLRAISSIFLIEGLATVSDAVLQRELRFRALTAVENLAYALGSGVLSVLLAFHGYGVWALTLGIIATRVIRLLILLCLIRPPFALLPSAVEARELLNLGAGFSLGRLLNFSALYGDNFVVGRMLGAEPLGIYTRAYQLMTLPAAYFGQVIERVLFPALSKRQADIESLRRVFFAGVEAVAAVGMPCAVFMYLAAPEIVVVIFGPQWEAAVPIFEVLALGVFFRLAYKGSDTLARAKGAVYRHAARQLIYAGFVVGGAFIGSLYGLRAVAWAVLLAVVVNYFAMTHLSLVLLGRSWRHLLRAQLPGIWIAGFTFAVIYPTLHLFRDSMPSAFARLGAASALAACAAVIGLTIAPRWGRMRSVAWLMAGFNFSKYGRAGGWAETVFRRCVVAEQG